jgi:hypothetical protein
MSNDLYQPKLQPELVPGPLADRSVFNALRRNKLWQMIRQNTMNAAGNQCQICGAHTRLMFCHEDWNYDDNHQVATLAHFMWICQDCNGAIHTGPKAAVGAGTPMYTHYTKFVTEIVEHVMNVNHMTSEEVVKMLKQAYQIYNERSKFVWLIEIHPQLLKQYPFLVDVKRWMESWPQNVFIQSD